MPYESAAQERWAHTAEGTKALGGSSAVHEWDEASKGEHLPERKMKSKKKHPFKRTVIDHHSDNSHTVHHEHEHDSKKDHTSAKGDLAGVMDQLHSALGGSDEPAGGMTPDATASPAMSAGAGPAMGAMPGGAQ